MPFWRKRELAFDVLRAALWYRKSSPRRLPIIHRGTRIVEANGVVRIGHLSEIHDRVALSAIAHAGMPTARLTIGDRTSIWYGTVISARREIIIGSECAISWHCSIIDDGMHELLELPDSNNASRATRPVHIDDHVWIGASSIVLPGVTIGRHAVVAAGAIVTHDVEPYTLVAGQPARAIRKIAGWR
jgi:acetyltransferase-like isoleucine patch superfamily enzyme